MTRAYFTLAIRSDVTAPWGIAFGDYDRETVTDERNSSYSDYRAANVKIIRTASDSQLAIDAAIAALNAS